MEWNETKLEARVWWCGDELCDCRQAEIDRITPNHRAGYPWIHREPVWRGTFYSDGEGVAETVEELRDECARRGIPIADGMSYALVHEE